MPRILISYRREDTSDVATHVFDCLERKYNRKNVFMDVASIPAGVDFRKSLQEAVSKCHVVLVVIGPDWLVDTKGNRRLEDTSDFVRVEVEAALDRDIRVIPVLVREAVMPRSEELPESIRDLAFRNAVRVRSGLDFGTDMDRLIQQLDSLPTELTSASPPQGLALNSTATPLQQVPLQVPVEPALQLDPMINNSLGNPMALILPGEFVMGSTTSDDPDRVRETPQHRVRINKPFYLRVHPVTQQEYGRVMGDNPSEFTGCPENPVDMISWNDAQEFCHRLSALEEEKSAGRVYRLPTEAQWEYACRAGSSGLYCFGDSSDCLGDYAWFLANSGNVPHPVGQKRANAWGLLDMHGNVLEWCADWYDAEYYAVSPADDPEGPPCTGSRVLRGGSCNLRSEFSRSAYRNGAYPDARVRYGSFRVAWTP